MNAQATIDRLKLVPHPEGGYYKETYRSDYRIFNDRKETRHACTAIYYLLKDEDKSLFHRIRSDELWFFHSGQPLEIVSIEDDRLNTIVLGNDIENGEVPQLRIAANTWFAACLKDANGFSLVSCTVSPGFDFADFSMANREELVQQFPQLSDIIEKFTRQD